MASVESDSWQERIAKAWEQKRHLLASTQAFRVVNGVFSGLPGMSVDWYNGHLVLFAYHPDFWDLTTSDILPITEKLRPKSVTLKDRTERAGDNRDPSRLLWGEAPGRVLVREAGMRFWIEADHAHNVGLFLDTREVRAWLGAHAHGRILNLFSYTCSLGAAAGLAGAETVNVDVSKRYLDWGRDNYHENKLDANPASFKAMPAERYLDWASKKKLQFDGVILDPPSFSRFEGKVFSLPKDYGRLVAKSAMLIKPGGFLIAMTNYAEASPQRLKAWIDPALESAGWREPEWFSIGPGADFDPPDVWRRTQEGILTGWRIVRNSA